LKLPPWTGVIGFPFDPWASSFVGSEVQVVVCRQRTTDKIVRIEQQIVTMFDEIRSQRLDVMDHDLSGDGMIGAPEIETIVPSDHQITNVFSFGRSIEPLVHPTFGTECRTSDGSVTLQVMEPVEKI
jgi:hypothetical protein